MSHMFKTDNILSFNKFAQTWKVSLNDCTFVPETQFAVFFIFGG